MTSYSSLADDYYVNLNLSTEMELAGSRETILHYFEQMQRKFPQMRNFYARDKGDFVLEEDKERGKIAPPLLAQGRARLLLVSGVGGAAEFGELAHRAGVASALAPRVTLGRAAASTHGNAAETADWARAHAVHSLIVVTAGYHMPRALAELGRALPGVALYPVPVQPPAMRGDTDPATFRLLAAEYTKWLATEAGLSALVSRTEERAQAAEHPEHRGGG